MRGAIVALAASACAAGALRAQVPAPRPPRPRAVAPAQRRPDTALARTTAARDSAAADTSRAGRGAGLPRQPSRSFADPDSVVTELLRREGYRITRYGADSVRFLAGEREIRLSGSALLRRDSSTLEADTVRYFERSCVMEAAGTPRLFDATGVVVGSGMRYDACNRVGIVGRATTDFQEGSATWFLRGDLALDNEEERLYASSATITSCDLPDPHYHFAARDVKWVSKRIMISRPAVLYVADVPVLWLPFVFQDLRRGRRSGLIPPQFGINDIVRNSPSYRRHVANLGYYWAMSDYSDAQVTMDWYAQRFVALNGRLRYRWLDRFITGGVSYQELRESGGNTSRRISLMHQQEFSLTSRLTASLDYATSARVISGNAVDPILAVATIDSRLNFQRRFAGGSLSIGGSRTQSLDKPQVTMAFPVVAFAPQPIALARNVVWSPSFNLTNATLRHGSAVGLLYSGPGDPDTVRSSTRQTSFSLATPLRIGRWNWANSISINDSWSNARQKLTVADPDDTTRIVTRTYGESFETSVDWSTAVNLPILLQGTWNLQPRVDIVNTGPGPLMIRNRFSGGGFVSQGKRLGYAASLAPTFFGLFGGIGPFARFRHAVSPVLTWQYTPAATLPEDYALAVSGFGRTVQRHVDARQTLSLGLSQNLEAKLRPPPRTEGADTAAAEPEGRKIKLVSIQSSGVSFDLEQARRPGRTGWATDAFSNTFSSDLLRGFSLATNHDLFDGPVGYREARFRPYLTSVSMRFSLGAGTLRGIGSILGLALGGPARQDPQDTSSSAADSVAGPGGSSLTAFNRGPLATRYTAMDRMGSDARGRAFQASLSVDVSRSRPDSLGNAPDARQTVSGNVSFSPTRYWSVSWQTQYNVTTGRFGEHVVRLDRDLHDWRASFSFVQSPNGNFLFNFFIQLITQPDIKFEYDQRNIR